MDAERWERIQSLFHDAAALPEDDRRRFLDEQCGDDGSLVTETLALLAEDARGSSMLDGGLAGVAAKMFSRPGGYTPESERFGAYRATRLLGEGGMGVVYLAERDDLGSVAAVKILRDAALSPARRKRFASEQQTLARLEHPSIARLFDAGTLADGTPWFVMEYVEGLPLTEYCAANDLSIAARLRVFRNVCEAVQHAHRHLVVHRDLKPSNIFVKGDGSVKLLDFGIAKHLENVGVAADQTRTIARLMTLAYAAPEQVRGGPAAIHTDVYALGVILYELLAGRLPFDPANRTSSEVEELITTGNPPPPSVAARGRVRPKATPREWADLDVLCLTAMRSDPQRRYATVDLLMRDVDHYLDGEPLSARPDSARYKLGKFVRRHVRAVAAASVAFALVLGLVIFYTVRLRIASEHARLEAARAQRIQRFTLALFDGGDAIAGPSDSLRVITLLDRGLSDARKLEPDPAVQAELYLTLGGIYQKMGKFARADSLVQLALDRRTNLLGSNHADVGSTLVALGDLRIDQARLEDAERLIRDGIATMRRTLPPDHPEVIRADIVLGRVLQERGAYDKAIPVLAGVVRAREASQESNVDIGMSLSALADVHFYAGHYDVSDTLNQRALAIYREYYGTQHPLVADILINLGAAQFDRGNYREAEAFDRQALAITQAFYGPDHLKTAGNVVMLARALVFETRLDEATALLQRALAIREAAYGPTHPLVASTLNELGNIAVQREHFDEAEKYFRRMLTIYHAVYGDKHYLIAIATSNLASTYIGRKDYVQAEHLYREAVRRFTDTQGSDHINTGIAHIKLGRALLRQNRFAEASVETLAGYHTLTPQANQSIGFLQNARKDLVAEYDALGQPERAARFRAELADTTKAAR